MSQRPHHEGFGTNGPGGWVSGDDRRGTGGLEIEWVDRHSDTNSEVSEDGGWDLLDGLGEGEGEGDEWGLAELDDLELEVGEGGGVGLTRRPQPGEWHTLGLEGLSLYRQRVVSDMLTMAAALFPEYPLPPQDAADIVTAAFQAGDVAYGVADAVAWAREEGWKGLPPEAIECDARDFAEVDFDLDALARQRLEAIAGTRLSATRIHATLHPENPEYAKMLRLADGFPLLTDAEYVPNGNRSWPGVSRLCKAAQGPIGKMFHDGMHQKGLAIYLRSSVVRQYIKDAGISAGGWAIAAGKRKGRAITNCSFAGRGNTPLNTPNVKEASDSLWGRISLPTIGDHARLLLDYFADMRARDPTTSWSDLRLWKMDLSGAFTLLSWDPSAVRHMAVELEDDVVIFFLCGIFGWTGMPAAFNVISRTIVWELSRLLQGRLLMYVDDIFGVCLARDLENDMTQTATFCRNLLGPTAIAEEKTESGRRLVSIGYTVDLDTRLVAIAERNALKALYGYMCVDVTAPVSVRCLQRLGSWGSRYGKICRYMRPFTRFLYAAYAKRTNPLSTVVLTDSVRLVVRLFRSLFLLGRCEEVAFSRALLTFQRQTPTVLAVFDASLTGIGIIWYRVNPGGTHTPIGCCAVDIRCLGFEGQSCFQNTSEFIAATLSIRGLVVLGLAREPLALQGDSVSALSWAKKDRVKGLTASAAGVIYVYQNIAGGIVVTDVIHCSHDENWKADHFSRDGTRASLAELDPGVDWRAVPLVEIDAQPVLELCRPGSFLDSDSAFLAFLAKVRGALVL